METRYDVVLVRHGETAWSRSGQHTGRTDLELTETGKQQSTHIGRRLHGREFAIVLTSPLRRASETASLSGFGAAGRADDLMEWDYGKFEGLTTEQIRQQQPGWMLWRDGVPGGETIDQVVARVDRIIARVRETNGEALLFAHGHLLRVLAARWIGLPGGDGRLLTLGAASISTLGHDHECPAIELWNDRSHLND